MEEAPEIVQVEKVDSSHVLLKLRQILDTCAKTLESEDFSTSDASVSGLVEFLEFICNTALSDPNDCLAKESALLVLAEVQRFVCSSSLSQMVIDALSFELPKAVARFASVSDECRVIAESIVDNFVAVCSPRDMHSVLCEALDLLSNQLNSPICLLPIFSGLAKVFLGIQRHHIEQAKVALPVILNVLKGVDSPDGEKGSVMGLVDRAIDIATSIKTVSEKLEEEAKNKLHAILGLYILQLTALSSTMVADEATIILLLLRLSPFLPLSGLSYLGLITGSAIVRTSMILLEDGDDFLSCFSLVKSGACLAVIWGHIADVVARAAGEDFTILKDQLKQSQKYRLLAIGNLNYMLSSVDLSWELKGHAIDFLLSILGDNDLRKCHWNDFDYTSVLSSLFSTLQSVGRAIMSASDAGLRKKAFSALQYVVNDVPPSLGCDLLEALIKNSNSSSMTAILIDLFKENVLKELKQVTLSEVTVEIGDNVDSCSLFCMNKALDLVEYILKPPKGGPPSLPEQSEAVVSALNLYRFLLILESTGKTNHSGVLSVKNLRKAYVELLLPLRALVSGIENEKQDDYTEIAECITCSLNPIQLVLYRCIELVEEKL